MRYAERRGWPTPTVRIEVESASRARLEAREELRALLADVQPGDVILVSKVDRWSRDLAYAVQSVRDLVARGIHWIAIGEDLDATTGPGDSLLGMRAWSADEERKRIRERMVGSRDALRDQGYQIEGSTPFGYRRGERSKRQQRLLFVVEDEARLVRRTFEGCAGGMSLAALTAWLSDETARAWDKGSVHAMLTNRLYLGEVRDSRGVWRESPHVPAIVTRAAFDAAQVGLASRRLTGGPKPREEARTASWLLRGMAFCAACGARMSAVYSKTVGGEVTGYFGCSARLTRKTCSAPYVRVDDADAVADKAALQRLRDLRRQLAASSPPEEPAHAGKPRDLEGLVAKNTKARARLVEAYADGAISRQDLELGIKRIDGEAADLARERAEEERRSAGARPELRAEALAGVAVLARAWRLMKVSAKREALGLLASRVSLRAEHGDVVVECHWRTAAEIAARRVK